MVTEGGTLSWRLSLTPGWISLAEDAVIAARFLNEARASNTIEHPGVVKVYEYGQLADGGAFIEMEFIEGRSLRQRLTESQKLPIELSLRIARQMAAALAAAHAKNIVHRDIKPDNVMLVPDRESVGRERVKILDFGIAKLLKDRNQGHSHTKTGMFMGTPAYMAPEQCRDCKSVGPPCDVYSLGAIVYEMICGQPPFGSGNGMELAMRIVMEKPVSLSERMPGVPTQLSCFVEELLAKDPSDRPTMAQVVSRLGALGERPRSRDKSNPSAQVDSAHQSILQSAFALVPKTSHQARLAGVVIGLGMTTILLGAGFLGTSAYRKYTTTREGVQRLQAIDTEMGAERWQSAEQTARRMAVDPRYPQQTRSAAQQLAVRSQREGVAHSYFWGQQQAAERGELAQSVLLFEQIPADSLYKERGRGLYQKVLPMHIDQQLSLAKEALEDGQCDMFQSAIGRMSGLDPSRMDVRELASQPCPALAVNVAGTEPDLDPTETNASGEIDSASVGREGAIRTGIPLASTEKRDQTVPGERFLTEAQSAYQRGHYRLAIALARKAIHSHPRRAWRIIGPAACATKDAPLAQQALRMLDSMPRQFLVYACRAKGVGLQAGKGSSSP
jgi:hypothetical protein